MEIIICPNCGQKMRTRALIRGTVLCPGCQCRFNAPEPNHAVVAPTQTKKRFEGLYLTLFTLFGLFWALLFTLTGGFRIFLWSMVTLSINFVWLLSSPFYLAQLFAALYFLTPIYTRLFGQQPGPRAPPLPHQQGGIAQSLHGGSTPVRPQEGNQERKNMMLFAGLGLGFFLISLLIIAVIAILLFAMFLLAYGGSGSPF